MFLKNVTFTHYNIYANLYIMMIKANTGGGILHFLTKKMSTKEIVLYSMILFVIDKNCLILLKKTD